MANDWYKGDYKTDWHLHILLVSKPSYALINNIYEYIKKNWFKVSNACEEDKIDISELSKKKVYKFSKADMKREPDVLEYIELLKKKHNISTIELPLEDYDFYWDPSFFKVINIRPVKAIEKRKAIYLYLNDYYEKVL